MEPKISKYLASLNKNGNIHHAFLKMIQSWRSMLNKGNKSRAIVMHLSEMLGIQNCNLLCKSKAKCFNVLTFIQTYFSKIHQRTKMRDSFSNLQKLNKCDSRVYLWSFISQHFYQWCLSVINNTVIHAIKYN